MKEIFSIFDTSNLGPIILQGPHQSAKKSITTNLTPLLSRSSFSSFCVKQKQNEAFKPLAPKSDKHLISPYNITLEPNIKVMRMEEMITN